MKPDTGWNWILDEKIEPILDPGKKSNEARCWVDVVEARNETGSWKLDARQ
jgi:hypothetical protein